MTVSELDKARVGFIGAGFAANLHASNLGRSRDLVDFAGVVAGSLDSAEKFAERHGVTTAYASVAAMLADRMDIVVISTPNASHEDLIVQAAEAGAAVVCEKPLTGAFGHSELTGADRAWDEWRRAAGSCRRIAAAVEASGRPFGYAENWVYAPPVTKTLRLLELAGGHILDIRAEESHSGSHALRSRRRATAGGGALLMLGAHPIGGALHLKAREASRLGTSVTVDSVVADAAAFHELPQFRGSDTRIVSDFDDVETWATTILSFSDGTKATIASSFAQLGGIRNTMEINSTNGVYRVNMTPSNALEVYTPDDSAFGDREVLQEKLEHRAGWMSVSPDEDWMRGYPQEVDDFVHSLTAGTSPAASLSLATRVVDVIYASYLSVALGRRVQIAERPE